MDKKDMDKSGLACLYLVHHGADCFKITNWPSSLVFRPVRVTKGHHNWGITRYDVWFYDESGKKWHGVNLGDNQILRCRRVKSA
jgi:hypothetical protein